MYCGLFVCCKYPDKVRSKNQHLLNACRWWVMQLTDFCQSSVEKCLCKFFPSFWPVFHRYIQFYFNQCISVNFLLNPASVMGSCFKSLYQRDLLQTLQPSFGYSQVTLGVNVVFSIELISVSVLEETDSVRALQDP